MVKWFPTCNIEVRTYCSVHGCVHHRGKAEYFVTCSCRSWRSSSAGRSAAIWDCWLWCCASQSRNFFFHCGIEYWPCQMYFINTKALGKKKDLSLLTFRLTLLLKPVPNTDQFACQNSLAKQFISNSLTHPRKQPEFSKCPFSFWLWPQFLYKV